LVVDVCSTTVVVEAAGGVDVVTVLSAGLVVEVFACAADAPQAAVSTGNSAKHSDPAGLGKWRFISFAPWKDGAVSVGYQALRARFIFRVEHDDRKGHRSDDV
jgi:hypothetical protein